MEAFTYDDCSNLDGFPKADVEGVSYAVAMLASAKKFDRKHKLINSYNHY